MTHDGAIPVHDAGNDVILGNQHELANGANHIGCGVIALTAAASGQTHLAMDAANPMDRIRELS